MSDLRKLISGAANKHSLYNSSYLGFVSHGWKTVKWSLTLVRTGNFLKRKRLDDDFNGVPCLRRLAPEQPRIDARSATGLRDCVAVRVTSSRSDHLNGN
jgi:hypothetical protein